MYSHPAALASSSAYLLGMPPAQCEENVGIGYDAYDVHAVKNRGSPDASPVH